MQVRPRSGLFARGVIAGFGTLDADYRGEIFVTMYCLTDPGHYVVQDGERIAQLVVSRLADVEWAAVDELDATDAASVAMDPLGGASAPQAKRERATWPAL